MIKITRCLPLLFAILLSACGPSGGSLPVSSATPTQAAATATLVPTTLPATLSPTPRVLSPTPPEPSPTFTPTLTETAIPLPSLIAPTEQATAYPQPAADSGAVQILSPGPQSKVVSPLKLRTYVIPGFDGKARIELFGEDGRLLVREIVYLPTGLKWAYYYQAIPFEVHAAAELGRLTVSTQDEYGRTVALGSVNLLLLSEGDEQINPPGNLKEHCVLTKPPSGGRVTGGVVHVEGLIRPFNKDYPLVIELVTRDGGVLNTREVLVTPAPDDSYVPFKGEVPYQISTATSALLVVRQEDNRPTGPMYLYSQEIHLNP